MNFRPMYEMNSPATAAPVETPPAEIAVATPTVTLQGPTAEQLATMTVADLAKLRNDIVAAASMALDTVEQAAKDLEAKAAADIIPVIDEAILLEQTFCQKHQIAVGAVNTWVAVIGGIVLLKLLGIL